MPGDFDLPDLSAKVRLDLTELEGAVGKASAVGSAIGSAVGSVAAGGIDSAIGAVTNFASGSVDAFAELEDSTAAASVVFGDGMNVIQGSAEHAAERVGLSTQQFISAANDFGTLGQAAGLQGQELAGFANKLTRLSGDMASFKGTSPEQAVEAIGAALRGEAEPIRAYGVLLDEATIKQEANRLGLVKSVVDHNKVATAKAQLMRAQEKLAAVQKDEDATAGERAAAAAAVATAQDKVKDALAGTTPELTKQQKLMATQSAIVRQTANAQGDFARTSDSTANTQKRLAAESANVQAQLGAKLAPAITAARMAVLFLITNLDGMFGWLSKNRDILIPLAAGIGIATIALSAHAIATTVVSAATRVWAGVQAAMNAVMSANPIGIVIAAIALLVAGIIIAYKRSETFRAIVDQAFAGIKVAITASMNAARAVIAAVMAFIQGDVTGKMATVRAVVVAVFNVIRTVIGAQIRAAQAIISGVLNVIVGIFTGDFGRAKEGAVKAIKGLLAYLGTLGSLITGALKGLGGLLLGIGGNMIDGLRDGIRAGTDRVLQAVRDLIAKIPEKIRKFLGIASPSKLMRSLFREVPEGAALGMLDGVGAVASAAATMAAASVPDIPTPSVGTGRRADATTLTELGPESLQALLSALTVNLQVLLDSEPIAARVNERAGAEASYYERTGG